MMVTSMYPQAICTPLHRATTHMILSYMYIQTMYTERETYQHKLDLAVEIGRPSQHREMNLYGDFIKKWEPKGS